MRLLLDTHTFLWLDNKPAKLSSTVRAFCQDPDTTLVLRVVSLWEILIKVTLGKLVLRTPLQTLLADQQRVNGIQDPSRDLGPCVRRGRFSLSPSRSVRPPSHRPSNVGRADLCKR